MTVLTCAAVRRQLADYHDRELPVQQLIAIETHLETCAACATEGEGFEEIGGALRDAAALCQPPADTLDGLRSGVVSRMCAEDEQSWRSRFGRTFEDLHLVWIGVTSAVATVICVAVALACIQFASPERNDSLAGIIAAMQSSNANMVRQTGDNDEIAWEIEQSMSEEQAVLALATVVTREGRLVNLQLIQDGRQRQRIDGLLNVISSARFEPGRYSGSPVPTNVNVLWLLARTTVRAKVVS